MGTDSPLGCFGWGIGTLSVPLWIHVELATVTTNQTAAIPSGSR
jgi:hypothetical protein